MNQNRRIRLGGLIVGPRGGSMNLRLVVNRHRWSRWCRSVCLHGFRGAETFLPDQHADKEDDQCNTNRGGWRDEGPMCLRWLNLIKLLEQFACVEFSVVLGPESLYGHVDALGVGPAEEFRQLVGPVHGLLLDLNGFGFVRRDHVIHSPDIQRIETTFPWRR
jgi:hypothetical protein